MENLHIGQWLLNNDGIEWVGTPYNGYYISKDKLLKDSLECPGCYDWLLHMAHKNWLGEEDIHALNTAFLCALEHFVPACKTKGLSMKKTLEKQYDIIQYKKIMPDKRIFWRNLLDRQATKRVAEIGCFTVSHV